MGNQLVKIDGLPFLCIKAVLGIEGKWGYELATVLNSTFCYKLLSMNTRC